MNLRSIGLAAATAVAIAMPAYAHHSHANYQTLEWTELAGTVKEVHWLNPHVWVYLATMDEISQVRSAHPRIGRHIGPPCVIRNGLISPRCTEGSHFCGVPVWRDFPNAVRRL